MSLNQQSNPAFRWDDASAYEVLGVMARQQCKLRANQKDSMLYEERVESNLSSSDQKIKGNLYFAYAFLVRMPQGCIAAPSRASHFVVGVATIVGLTPSHGFFSLSPGF